MKKLFSFLVLLIVMTGPIWAQGGAVEVRGLYFHPTEKAFQNVYGNSLVFGGGAFIGLGKHMDVWVSGDYFRKKGELTFSKEETTLQIIPVYAGLRWRFPGNSYHFYVSAGVGYFWFKEENLMGTVKESNISYLGKAGCFVKVFKGVYVDAHFQYTYGSVQPLEVKNQISGLSLGLGIGYDFGLGEKQDKWIWRKVK